MLALAVVALLTGCATGAPRGNLTGGFAPHSSSLHDGSTSRRPVAVAARGEATGGSGELPEDTADPFQVVQEASGLKEEARHPAGAALYLGQARQLLDQLLRTPVTYRSFAPRRVLCWLLSEVLAGGERVEYADLKWRAERFWLLVMVRPGGYLVTALTGTPLQRMGQLQLVEGQWRVGRLAVGDFYFSRGGVFYPVNEALRRVDVPPLAELGLGKDWLNAALDGAQVALGEMVVSMAHSSSIPSAPWRTGPTAHHGGEPHRLLTRVLRALRGHVPGGPDSRGGTSVHARAHAARGNGGHGGAHGWVRGGAARAVAHRQG
ncbi:hypothetical protein ACN28S_52365 [Cystobacter fuscus]